MDLADLRIFRSVVDEGGITRAAEKLNRVQSNVTTRVRQLEEDLGVNLFIREGKRLHLSPTGKLLLERVRDDVLEEEILEAVGAGFEHLVKINNYLVAELKARVRSMLRIKRRLTKA